MSDLKGPKTELRDGSVMKITANGIPSIAGSIQRRPSNTSCLKNWESKKISNDQEPTLSDPTPRLINQKGNN